MDVVRHTDPAPRPPPDAGSCRLVPVVTGALAVVVGVVVLAGWALDSELLKRLHSGLPSMKPLTALAVALAGTALVVLRETASPRSWRAGRALGAVVAVIGLAVGAEYLLGDLGIDDVLFGDAGADPSRPSQHTAVALVLIGTALATTDLQRLGRRAHPLLAGASAVVMLFGTVSYMYGVDYLRGESQATGIAVHTLVALTALTAGLVCLRPGRGIAGHLRRSGPEAVQGRVLLVSAVVIPLLLGALLFTGRERINPDSARVRLSIYTLVMIGAMVAVVLVSQRRVHTATLSRRRLAAVVDSSDDAIIATSLDGTILSWNRGAAQTYGYSAADVVGRSLALLSQEAHAGEVEALLAPAAHGEMIRHLETQHVRSDGHVIDVSLTMSPFRDDVGHVAGVATIARDMTAQKQAERALAQSEERIRRSFEDSAVGMALVAVEADGLDGFMQTNDALASITGYSAEQLAARGLTTMVHADDRPGLDAELRALLRGDLAVLRRDVQFVGASGTTMWVTLSISLVLDPAGNPVHAVLQAQDVSERKRFEGQLQHLADHDALTGLFNRRRFEAELTRALAEAHRYGTGGAVIVFDLDDFKTVNDTLGHAAGDELVRIVAQLLGSRLRDSDIAGRLGGDEFGVIVPHAQAPQARALAEDLLELIRQDARAAGVSGTRRVTASIGVAPFSDRGDAVTAEELLAEADIAMYDAKEAGRNRVAVFDIDAPRHERMRARTSWTEKISAALDEDRFVLHAQPIVPLHGRPEPRYELLVRMRDERGDLIPPGVFLSVAEKSDLAQEIDRWVVQRATQLLAQQRRHDRAVTFAVNLSAASLVDPRMADFVGATLTRPGVDAGGLAFEVSESAAIVNVTHARTFAARVREAGAAFALDDFGAGFASFTYLRHLPFDYLKIDGELVESLAKRRTDALIVRAVIDIARSLGKQTVAKFVADDSTVAMLAEMGADYAQGFYLGAPEPIADIDFDHPPTTTPARR